MKTTLLITSRNEINGMKAILPKIRRDWVDEILVVDGNSTDGSLEYAESLGFKTLKQKSKGLVGAYWEALEVTSGDIIIPFSPDGNSLPERIPDLVEKMKDGYAMVICSRYCGGAKSEDDDIVTAFGNWMFTRIINLLFGGHYTDTLVMFRAWRRDVVEAFRNKNIDNAGFEPMLAIECAKKKLKVTDIPGDEPKRIGGTRKMNPLINGSAIVWLISREFFSR